MAATYDAVTDRISLTGDGSGWSRCSVAMPTPPAGTDKAIYVMRFWNTRDGSDLTETGFTWNNAHYLGFKFNSTHIATVSTASDFDDFFGIAAFNASAAATTGHLDFNTSYDDMLEINPQSSYPGHTVFDGNGSTIVTGGQSMVNSFKQAWGMPEGATFGQTMTMCWMVWGSEVDDSVLATAWVNAGTIDLSTFNLATDLDPDDPTTSIPVSGSRLDPNNTIHGDITATNWRPTTGTMAFPTHFMARYPMRSEALVIDYLGVQYSQAS